MQLKRWDLFSTFQGRVYLKVANFNIKSMFNEGFFEIRIHYYLKFRNSMNI